MYHLKKVLLFIKMVFSLDYCHVKFIMIYVLLIIRYLLVSLLLVQKILPYVLLCKQGISFHSPLVIAKETDISLLNMKKKWSSITVNNRLFQDNMNEFALSDYSHVQYIDIQSGSFTSVSSVSISNLPKLKLLLLRDKAFLTMELLTLSSIDIYISG